MWRFVRKVIKGAAIVGGIVGLAVAAAVVLTDPDPATLPARLRGAAARVRPADWASAAPDPGPAPAPASAPTPGPAAVPLFSDDWFDDSGYSFATPFSGTPADPTSLEGVRAQAERAARGVAYLEKTLRELAPGAREAPAQAEKLHLMIGALHMYEGRFAEAGAEFALAQQANRAESAASLANIEALRGVAALRLGEVENCVSCCNEASCIFPLAREAVHLRPAGSRAAIGHFTRYLRQRPEDLGARWLLNVACMTLGEYPDGVPPEFLLPLGRFAPAPAPADGGPPRLVNVAARAGLNARGENMAGGCLVEDFDGDGRLDLFTSTADFTRGASFWHNRGDGTFEDRSAAAGLADQVGALNASMADYDNDGALDVLLLRGGWETPQRPSLLRNRGDGTFEDVTKAAGLIAPIASQAAGWADYDNDGFADLYIAGEYQDHAPDPRCRGRLYHNRGDGTFEDVAESAGVLNERFGKGLAWGDFDDDGRPDLYVSNLGQPNRLYHNRGDGTFRDVADLFGVGEPIHSFACWFWDYDNDGRLDLWVNPYGSTLSDVVRDQLGRPTRGERPRLYRNVGGPEMFRDVTRALGLDRVVLPMGSNFGDLDGDGYLDIYLGTGRPLYSYLVPNVMFRNEGGRSFEDVTAATGTGHLQKGHGVAFADWDRDGDLDVFLEAGGATPGDRAHNLLFQNPGRGHHWLTVRLIGTRTNRAALGAKLRVDLPGPDGSVVSRYRTISTGSSFGGNPLACTVGLGRADSVAMIEVTWPTSGTRQVFRDVPIDRSVEITEGRDALRVLDAPPLPQP